MQPELNEDTKTLILQDFEMEGQDPLVSEDELFAMLADRIAYMIEHKLDFLLSLMYRLDVKEAKVQFALSPLAPDPPHIGLAKLVMERQRVRMATKLHYKQPKLEDIDEELKF
ncbi:MAG: hypothetical protein KDC44_11365 [Phaeodactylibacter sp.]|nr:hypothetical protein [Phaeodactylibacter sp.]